MLQQQPTSCFASLTLHDGAGAAAAATLLCPTAPSDTNKYTVQCTALAEGVTATLKISQTINGVQGCDVATSTMSAYAPACETEGVSMVTMACHVACGCCYLLTQRNYLSLLTELVRVAGCLARQPWTALHTVHHA
jgi:hypothetical protein